MTFLGFPPDAPFAVLAEATAKGTLVLLGGAVAAAALGRASSALRHLTWTLALAALVILPVLLAVGPRWRVAVPVQSVVPRAIVSLTSGERAAPAPATDATLLRATVATPAETPVPAPKAGWNAMPETSPRAAQSRTEATTGSSGAIAVPPAAATSAPAMSGAATPAPRVSFSWKSLVLGVWFAGFAAMLAVFALGHVALRVLLRGARPLRDAEWQSLALDVAETLRVDVPFLLLQGRALAMPVAFGILRPRVLLPAGASEWPADRRRAVLLHELAHVRRHDCLTQVLAQLACAAFWFHPGVWFAAHRLRVERERACDDLVLAAHTRASDYADHLLQVARTLRAGRLASFGAVAFARPSQFEGRLLAVLDPVRDRSGVSARRALPAVAVVAVLLAVVAAFQPVPAAVAGDQGRKAAAKPKPHRVAPSPPGDAAGRYDAEVRAAIGSLARLPAAEAVERLAEIANGDESPELRRAAVEALGGLGTSESLEALLEIARDGADDAARAQAFAALGEEIVGEDVAAPPAGLAPIAPEDAAPPAPVAAPWPAPEPALAPETDRALRRTVERRIQQEQRREELREQSRELRRQLESLAPMAPGGSGRDDLEVLGGAIEALSRYPEAQSFPRLRELAESHPDGGIRVLAVESLSRLGTPAALSVIQQLAWKSTSDEARAAAIGAIANGYPAGEAVAILQRIATSHPDESARGLAVEALYGIDDPKAREALEKLVETGSPEAQRQAVECIGRDDENALAKLLAIVRNHASEETRRQAVETLGRLDGPGVLPALIALAQDGAGGEVASQAAECIGRRDEPGALPALVKLTRPPAAPDVQMRAVETLGRRDENDVPRLLLDLARSHPSPGMQRLAVESLGRRDDVDVMKVLGGIAADHPSPEVRRQAVDTMTRRDPDAALPVLEKILEAKKAKKRS